MGRSEHTFGENDLWCTPPEVFEPVLEALRLDAFGLDPFGNPLSIVPAKEIVLLPDYVAPILDLVTRTLRANGWTGGAKPGEMTAAELGESVETRYAEFLATTKRVDSRIYYADAYVPQPANPQKGHPHAWSADWSGRGAVFCNGPTSACEVWAEKQDSPTGGDENVSLWPVRTGAKYFKRHIATCDVVLFWEGRVKYRGAKHHAPWHNCLSYRGPRGALFWEGMRRYGWGIARRRKEA